MLGQSVWGDPGSDEPQEIQLWLRLSWGRRVARDVPQTRPWAMGAIAILLAAEMFVTGRFFDSHLATRLGLGSAWPGAPSPSELRARLPGDAAWALAGIEAPADLWRAELAWWRRLGQDAETMIRRRLDGPEVVVGTVALLALDVQRVNAALAVADRGGSTAAREVVDALC